LLFVRRTAAANADKNVAVLGMAFVVSEEVKATVNSSVQN
jgi:hypothetical protein